MPGSPRNPAMTTVAALTGKYRFVKMDMELSSHRQQNPQAELMKNFQMKRMGSAMMRSRAQRMSAGIKIMEKFSMMTSG